MKKYLFVFLCGCFFLSCKEKEVDFSSNNCKIGIANAAVLPVPVCAQPKRSLPSSIDGIAFD